MKEFKKYYIIPAPPADVYKALTNPWTIQLWSGDKAVMSEIPGSEFELWDGAICGKNISFEEGFKIEQEWYFGDQEPASIVTIKLHADKRGTSAELRHTNIPDDAYENITEGWDQGYFGALQEFYKD